MGPLARRAIDPLYVIKALFFDVSLFEIQPLLTGL
jgi:hypothetical protein